MFQSTHPLGVRLFSRLGYEFMRVVSIHAPTRGATIESVASNIYNFCFNPRTHSGCDSDGRLLPVDDAVSIHAPTRGATAYSVID